MAKLVKNDKGFKVVKLSIEEAKQLGWGIDHEGHCLCMHCNEMITEDIYYPVVLHDVMDKKCYEKWLSTATNYPEDKIYEDRAYNSLTDFLDIEEE